MSGNNVLAQLAGVSGPAANDTLRAAMAQLGLVATGLVTLAESGIPFVRQSSCTVGNNGAISGMTGFNTVYGWCYTYWLAGGLFSGSEPGWYLTNLDHATSGKVYNYRYTTGTPTVPANPPAIVATGPGAYTQTTGLDIPGPNVVVPANLLGPNGSLVWERVQNNNNSAGNKVYETYLGANPVSGGTDNTNPYRAAQGRIHNRGVVTRQIAGNGQNGDTGALGGLKYLTCDTSQSIILSQTLNCQIATDYAVIESFYFGIRAPLTAVPTSEYLAAPVTVPNNYVGLCSTTASTPDRTFNFSFVRSWDFWGNEGFPNRAVMCKINPSANVMVWDTFDDLFRNNADKDIVFVLGSPADYLVSRSATGGAYLGGKSNMCPDDLATWGTVVAAVVHRAKTVWGRVGLKWELWNEIDNTACYNDTVTLLGPYTKTTVTAIFGEDPTAFIIYPSISNYNNFPTTFNTYITASDGGSATSAAYGDAVAWHYYTQANWAYEHPINYLQAFSFVEGYLKANNLNYKIYITECGIQNAYPDFGNAMMRRMLTFAACGAQCYLGYSYDATGYAISSYKAQWNKAAALLQPGNVISSFIPGFTDIQITVNGVAYQF